MIERVIQQQKALSLVLKGDKNKNLAPTWQEMDVLESVSKTLSVLTEFTDTLSGEDYVSVIPQTCAPSSQ